MKAQREPYTHAHIHYMRIDFVSHLFARDWLMSFLGNDDFLKTLNNFGETNITDRREKNQ